jgi:hypothetical protein
MSTYSSRGVPSLFRSFLARDYPQAKNRLPPVGIDIHLPLARIFYEQGIQEPAVSNRSFQCGYACLERTTGCLEAVCLSAPLITMNESLQGQSSTSVTSDINPSHSGIHILIRFIQN